MKVYYKFLNRFGIMFLIIFFLFADTNIVAASCVAKSSMSPELAAYIKTTDNLLSKIAIESTKKQCGLSEDGASANIEKTTSAIVGAMNESIGFSNFSTSGRFYIGMALKTEIPSNIIRDHALLGKELDRIKNAMEMVYNRCAEDVTPTSNLSEDPTYSTVNKTLGVMLKEILRNQVDMMNFYRETVLGDATKDQYSFILVGGSQEFITKFQGNYGPAAFNVCNGESDFFKSIKESFGRITKLGGGIGKGMDDWRKANNLLNSNSSNQEYAEIERNLLRGELSNQGMSTKGSQVIMNNLAIYNNQSASEGLSGFVSSVGERVYASVSQLGSVFKGMVAMIKSSKTTDEYMKNTQALIILKTDINTDIRKDYENAKSLIGTENISSDEMLAKLLDMHILLESTNRFLQPYIKVSENTCKKQGEGLGNCSF